MCYCSFFVSGSGIAYSRKHSWLCLRNRTTKPALDSALDDRPMRLERFSICCSRSRQASGLNSGESSYIDRHVIPASARHNSVCVFRSGQPWPDHRARSFKSQRHGLWSRAECSRGQEPRQALDRPSRQLNHRLATAAIPKADPTIFFVLKQPGAVYWHSLLTQYMRLPIQPENSTVPGTNCRKVGLVFKRSLGMPERRSSVQQRSPSSCSGCLHI